MLNSTNRLIDVNQNQSQSNLINKPNGEEQIEDPNNVKNAINQKLHPIQHCGLALSETLNILCEFSGFYSQQTKLAALEWLHTLMDVAPQQTLCLSEMVFPSLFKFVIDPSSSVSFFFFLIFCFEILFQGHSSWFAIGLKVFTRKRISFG